MSTDPLRWPLTQTTRLAVTVSMIAERLALTRTITGWHGWCAACGDAESFTLKPDRDGVRPMACSAGCDRIQLISAVADRFPDVFGPRGGSDGGVTTGGVCQAGGNGVYGFGNGGSGTPGSTSGASGLVTAPTPIVPPMQPVSISGAAGGDATHAGGNGAAGIGPGAPGGGGSSLTGAPTSNTDHGTAVTYGMGVAANAGQVQIRAHP